MAFSADGRYLAASDSRAFHLWDLTAGPAPLWSRAGSLVLQSLAFVHDGVTVGGAYDPVVRYDVRTGTSTADPFLTAFRPDQFSPDSRFALAVTSDRDAHILRLRCARAANREWVEAWQKEIPFDPAHGFAGYLVLQFSSNGDRFLRLSWRGASVHDGRPMRAEVFESNTGERIAEWTGKLSTATGAGAMSPAGTVLLLHHRMYYAIDTSQPRSKPVKRRNASAKHFTSAAFTRDGRWLATTSNDTAATIWDATTWEVHRRCEWQIGRLRTVCFAQDGLRCAAGSDSEQIVVWDLDG